MIPAPPLKEIQSLQSSAPIGRNNVEIGSLQNSLQNQHPKVASQKKKAGFHKGHRPVIITP